MTRRKYDCQYGCPVEATLDVIGGKWKCVILFHLLDSTKRFSQLRRLLPDVTQRMLTLQLRELEEDGVLVRTVYAQVPPRVEYKLSEFGQSLRPVLLLMRQWGVDYMDQILAQKARASAERADSLEHGESVMRGRLSV